MKALIFDVDDTLYDLEGPFRKTFEDYHYDQYDIDVDRLFQYVRFYSDQAFDDSVSGKISMDDMYAYRLQMAFQEFRFDLSREDALKFQRTYAAYQKKISMTDTMRRGLDRISSTPGFLGIISNGMYEHQMDKVRALGLTKWIPKDHILISEECGFSKPDVRIFQYAKEKWDLDPKDTWYVGDTFENDVAGPKKAGWHAVWFNHRNRRNPTPEVIPDDMVTDEAEMIDLLLDLREGKCAGKDRVQ